MIDIADIAKILTEFCCTKFDNFQGKYVILRKVENTGTVIKTMKKMSVTLWLSRGGGNRAVVHSFTDTRIYREKDADAVFRKLEGKMVAWIMDYIWRLGRDEA